jgi:hypothetical protein
VNREEEFDETGEEEKDGDVKHGWYGLDSPKEVKCLHALEKVCPCTSALV